MTLPDGCKQSSNFLKTIEAHFGPSRFDPDQGKVSAVAAKRTQSKSAKAPQNRAKQDEGTKNG